MSICVLQPHVESFGEFILNMKYSILGFNQERVLALTKEVKDEKNGKTTTISIDVDDLLILSVIADIQNRKIIRKVILEDGQYAWISYNVILEDLPILRIDKKQLRRRLDKLVEFELIDLKVERVNGSGTFVYIKIGKEYEALKYNIDEESKYTSGQKSAEGVDKNVHGGGQKCLPKDSLTKQEDNNKEDKEERDKSLSKKERIDYDAIVKCWNETNPTLSSVRMLNDDRKKQIRKLLASNNATVDDLMKAIKIISMSSFCQGKNDRNWRASFDWLIKDTKSCFSRLFEGVYAFTQDEKNKLSQYLRQTASGCNPTIPNGWTQEQYDMYISNGYIITEDGRVFKDGKEIK